MTQLLSEAAHNLSAFSHERDAREDGRLVCGAQHITQARYEAERPLNFQKLAGQPRAFPAREKDSRSRQSDTGYQWFFHTHITDRIRGTARVRIGLRMRSKSWSL